MKMVKLNQSSLICLRVRKNQYKEGLDLKCLLNCNKAPRSKHS